MSRAGRFASYYGRWVFRIATGRFSAVLPFILDDSHDSNMGDTFSSCADKRPKKTMIQASLFEKSTSSDIREQLSEETKRINKLVNRESKRDSMRQREQRLNMYKYYTSESETHSSAA